MKKLITLILVFVTLFAGGLDVVAKTPAKKRSSSSSAVKFSHYYDGYPDVNGHTYTTSIQGLKCTLTFGSFYGLDEAVEIKASYKGQWEKEYEGYSYEGDGEIFFYMSGVPCHLEISDDGKKLVNMENEDIVFKLVK